MIDGTLNVADQGAQGIDLEVRYGIDTRVGQIEAALLWTHLLERTKTPFAGAPQEELAGMYTDVTEEDGGAYPGDKANVSLQWYRDNLSIGYLGEYVGGMDTAAAFIDYSTRSMPGFIMTSWAAIHLPNRYPCFCGCHKLDR